MTLKKYLVGATTLGVLIAATLHSPSYCRVLSSARSVGCYIHDIRGADRSMNIVERFLFGMALADSSTPPARQ
jgi:hypothetical protein